MRRSRFSEEQVIGILKEREAGLSAPEICRGYGISDATFCKWRSKYGGMDVSDARRLKKLLAGSQASHHECSLCRTKIGLPINLRPIANSPAAAAATRRDPAPG